MKKIIELGNQQEQLWLEAKEFLFEQIKYIPSFNLSNGCEEWQQYDDPHESLPIRIHNIGIGLLLDNKWQNSFMIEQLYHLGDILIDNKSFDRFILGYIHDYNFKYLKHPLLQKQNYNRFLESTYWKLTKELKECDHRNCQLCGKYFDENSHLHHNNYAIRGFEHLKNVRNEFLTLLCAKCHNLFHKNDNACKGWEL
jgi:hypothetical protein